MSTEPGRKAAGNGFLTDTWVNLKRWMLKTVRNPFVMTFSLINPVMFLVLFTQVFGGVAGGAISDSVGGSASYVTYLVPAIAIQVALIGATSSGVGLVNDIESGMFEKALVSPMHRGAIFLGKSLSEVLRIVLQVCIILVVGFPMFYLDAGGSLGDYVATGVLGAIGIVCVGVLFAIWFTALSNIVALVTRDQESTMIGVNIVQFPLLFLSSAFLPLDSLPGWVQVVAAFNPVTYGVDAARALMFGRDVMTLIDVTAFGGMWNTLVPAVAVLGALDIALGALAVYFIARSTSAEAR
ncbi:ABC transporter, permease protein [Halarchaeum acidiphilum MH1-52-1]|uniref:ABC transporter, permease protein n=1 Tax=Halarchaeum acidiphilum MH1-52-1 TaxID=1261545 RepID=U2YW49_9EURY|nr:ABC transporter permease [Halarchaeum acidiphilum]GAD53012.1 ABC transporter, permease protein [Halarchaeum acidiphilum MH1-52-1]